MFKQVKKLMFVLMFAGLILFGAACSVSPGPEAAPTPTPTPAGGGGGQTTSASPCQGVSGVIEMQVLVGPSEAVGLEPVAVGEIPFSVIQREDGYIVQGSGDITYEAVLEKEWGTYSVNLDMTAALIGECREENGEGVLDMVISASGEQMVEVRAEGFQGDYPWSGTRDLPVVMPLLEGASAEGEGWTFILHISP